MAYTLCVCVDFNGCECLYLTARNHILYVYVGILIKVSIEQADVRNHTFYVYVGISILNEDDTPFYIHFMCMCGF